MRVEHWVVAERQGQSVARTLLGGDRAVRRRPLLLERALRRDVQLRRATPRSGTRPAWTGRREARDCRVELSAKGTLLAVITLGRDRQSLEAEVALARARLSDGSPCAPQPPSLVARPGRRLGGPGGPLSAGRRPR